MTKVELLQGLTKWHEELIAKGDRNNAKFVQLTMSILVEEIEHGK